MEAGGTQGALGAMVILLGLALYFLNRARVAALASARWANAGLGVALAGFALKLVMTYLAVPSESTVALAARAVVGFVAVGLVIQGFRVRAGGSRVRLIVAAVVAAAGLLMTLASLQLATMASTRGAWVYHASDASYGIALPSDCWRENDMTGPRPHKAFTCARPRMQAIVMSVRSQQGRAELDAAVATARASMEETPRRSATLRSHDGTNPSGHRYYRLSCIDHGDDGEVLVAHCFTWNAAKQLIVELLVEGQPRMLSEDGKAAEAQAFEAAARTICDQVQ